MKPRLAATSGTPAPSERVADAMDAMYGQHLVKVKRWARRLAGPSADLEDVVHELGINGRSASQMVPITDWTKQAGVVLADVSGDGHLDVVIDDNEAIMLHVGDGKGGFPYVLNLPASTPLGQRPFGALPIGDLNRDGKLEVVFSRDDAWGALPNTCP